MIENSNLNITYYLGAGASAQALPTIKKNSELDQPSMIEGLLDAAYRLENGIYKYDQKYNQFVSNLIIDLKWLSEKTREFGTPDTFAKFLYLKEKGRLSSLKNALTAYFLILQFLDKKIDKRALVFLVTILDKPIFPPNIKIITWNYDFQIQLAAESFWEERYERFGKISKHSPPFIPYYPALGHDGANAIDGISLVHLNGIAGTYFDDETHIFKSFFERKEERMIDDIFKLLSNRNHQENTFMSFAWENNSQKRIEIAKHIASQTDILVIIGYSFPFFNRKIDQEIFDEFRVEGKLKVVYHQDPFKSGEFLRNQFKLSNAVEIRDIKEASNYFVPLEL